MVLRVPGGRHPLIDAVVRGGGAVMPSVPLFMCCPRARGRRWLALPGLSMIFLVAWLVGSSTGQSVW
jgi:hypothetical protein